MRPIVRRRFLRHTAGWMAGTLATEVLPTMSARAQSVPGNEKLGIKALFFDIFGTCVDWRTGVAREAEAILKPFGHRLDWLAFADAWRTGYDPAMNEVRTGRKPFVRLDVIHRQLLDALLPKFGVKDLPEAAAAELNLAWHRLDGWPDLTPGMARLSAKFLLAPCSNANIALMTDLARRNKIRFDAILGADVAQDFKPKPRVYLASVEAFGLQPSQCMMVSAASHTVDVVKPAKLGLRTGTVDRPNENGPGKPGNVAPKQQPDVTARDLNDLADKLGA